MSTRNLTGVVPPIVTPFLSDGSVDVPTLERLTERLVAAGCHGVFALGSTGEVAYLDTAQRRLVLETIVRVVDRRVPVLAGAIDLTAARVKEHLAVAEEAGVDAVVVTAPVYAINDMAEIEQHLRSIAAATRLDVWAYDIPARVKTKLDGAMLVRLGAEGIIAGVKDSSGDDVSFRRLVRRNRAAGSPLSILTGHEVVVDGMLMLGADGIVPGLANVDPVGYVRLWEAAVARDWAAAVTEQDRLSDLFEIVFRGVGMSGDAAGVGAFKAALHHLGELPSGLMAAPTRALSASVVSEIATIVDHANIVSVAARAS